MAWTRTLPCLQRRSPEQEALPEGLEWSSLTAQVSLSLRTRGMFGIATLSGTGLPKASTWI